MRKVDPDRFVSLDESCAKTTMTRRYGRAPRGERVVDHVPAEKYHSTTVLGAPRRDGTIAALVDEGVVKLPETKRGFVLLPRRWVVERSFGWAARFRRLARDYERLTATLEGLHYVDFSLLMLQKAAPLFFWSP
jgi:transposase